MSAKAVVVFNPTGSPIQNAEVTLQHMVLPDLTNGDGYILSPYSHHSGATYVKVLATGYAPAVYPISLDDQNQEVHLGGDPNSGPPNTIHLPSLTFKSAPIKEPTREQVCNVYCGFQGISILTREFGWIPAFGPETSSLADDDLISYCHQMKQFGFTHVEFDISWRYSEPDYSYPVPGRDLSNDLPEVCRRLNIIIDCGMMIKFSLAGDGLSVGTEPYGYNDPQGWTYGYEWLTYNLRRILFALRTNEKRDLTKWTLFVPGYDGVFYGWGRAGEVPDRQPERVINFGRLFRTILPNGYLGIEHTTGTIPVGEGSDNWQTGGVLDAYDTLFSEFDPWNLHQDSTWQIIGRCARPFIRPADMPAGDDDHPDFYMHDCTRGKRFYIIYEFKTYRWTRGCTYAEVLEAAQYLHAMAPETTICALLN